MKVAIPVFENRVSPRFDCSKKILLVRIEDDREIEREEISLLGLSPMLRVRQLKSLGVDTVLCGAIDAFSARMLASNRIKVIPRIMGEVEEIARLYVDGQFDPQRFMTPGCKPCRHFRGGRKDSGVDPGRCKRERR